MLDPKLIDDLVIKFSQLLPPELGTVRQDLQKNTRQLLQNWLSELDFVTREEFDIQTRLLANARQQLAQVSEELARLEKEYLT